MTQSLLAQKSQEYINSQFERVKTYLHKEIAVLDSIFDYEASSKLLEQLPNRIRLVVYRKCQTPNEDELSNSPDEERKPFEQQRTLERKEYLKKVADELETISNCYHSTDGSFWEFLSDTLKELGTEFKEKTRM